MGIAEEIIVFEEKLNELVRKYEQYFIGLEKREPIKLLEEVERTARKYVGTNIVNTMVKFKYNSLVARLQSYRQYWNRINREIEEGRYSRDKFRMGMHQQSRESSTTPANSPSGHELEGVYTQYLEARKSCSLGTDNINPASLLATLERQKESLQLKHNCANIEFRVVIEDGKPKIKARPKH
jgi:plasmid replication initiation protein